MYKRSVRSLSRVEEKAESVMSDALGVISGNAQREKSEPLFRFTLHALRFTTPKNAAGGFFNIPRQTIPLSQVNSRPNQNISRVGHLKISPIFNRQFHGRLILLYRVGPGDEEKINKVHNRDCFVEEFIRKLAPYRISFASMVPTFPIRSLSNKTVSFFLKEKPHGFKNLCRWITVFCNRS